MTGRDFLLLWVGFIVGRVLGGASAGRQAPRPAPDPERARAARAFFFKIFGVLAIVYAVGLAGFDLYVTGRVMFAGDPWEPGLSLVLPGLAAASAFLAWLGIRLLTAAPDEIDRADWHVRARQAGRATRRAARNAAVRTGGLRAAFVAFFPFAALAYAAALAGIALFVIGGLILGSEPWDPGLPPILTWLAAASAFLAWLGVRLLRGRDLRAEYAQAWDDARTLLAPPPDAGKPKPSRDADLD